MQNSSPQIGAIAAALAKAQAQLANPEKTLTAALPSSTPAGREKVFRYASLASGLDIVRKALGANEIAIIQTTAIERKSKTIQLTTTLAHASGEWLATEWPVCSAEETDNPQRLGAALTYARRYALFALVGIAGEDDLDAPDLGGLEGPAKPNGHAIEGRDLRSAPAHTKRESASLPGSCRTAGEPPRPVHDIPRALSANKSRELRERMLAEIAALTDADAADWVYKNLPVRDTLLATDAQLVDRGFQARVASFGEVLFPDMTEEAAPRPTDASTRIEAADATLGKAGAPAQQDLRAQRRVGLRPPPIGPKPLRLKDKDHCRFVANQPCLICGRTPTDPHHLRFAQPRALGRKVSDEFVVPVCRTHHRELHRYGDEASWWAGVAIDPIPIALDLWQQSRDVATLPEWLSSAQRPRIEPPKS